MKCEYCGNEHDGSYGTGRFCSESCKQNFVAGGNHPCKCVFCGREFQSGRALGGHVIGCKLNPNRSKIRERTNATRIKKFNQENPIEKHILVCQSCGHEFELEVRKSQYEKGKYRKTCSTQCAHRRHHSEEYKQLLSQKIKEKVAKNGCWGSAKIGSPPKMITCICEECETEFHTWDRYCSYVDGFFSHRFCSPECSDIHKRKMLSQRAKERCARGEFGGKNNETYKKHKHGWYKGLYCGSSWELAFVLWKTHNGFVVKRSNKVLPYEYNGKTFNYYPDFEIDGIIYEVKGFEDFKAQAKHEAYPEIEYYNKERMKPILEEVKKIFGENFVDLLEDHK